jgi:hypothetical protein
MVLVDLVPMSKDNIIDIGVNNFGFPTNVLGIINVQNGKIVKNAMKMLFFSR